jgi:hypothetical protein
MLSTQTSSTDKGPIIDTNPVFDFTFVLPPLKTYSLYMTKETTDSYKVEPDNYFKVNFRFQFDDWKPTEFIPVPYNIVFKLSAPPSRYLNGGQLTE